MGYLLVILISLASGYGMGLAMCDTPPPIIVKEYKGTVNYKDLL